MLQIIGLNDSDEPANFNHGQTVDLEFEHYLRGFLHGGKETHSAHFFSHGNIHSGSFAMLDM